MSFSKAKYYRNMPGADGKRIYKALEDLSIQDKLTEHELQKIVGISQRLHNIETDYEKGRGDYVTCVAMSSGETERGVVDVAALRTNHRQSAYDELDRLLSRHKEWRDGTPFLKKKVKVSSKIDAILAEFKDLIVQRSEALHALYLSYIEGSRDLTGSALVDFRAECKVQVASHQAAVANDYSRIVAANPTFSAHLEGPCREFVSLAKGHLGSYEPETTSVADILENWDDALPADQVSYTAPDLTSTEVREKFLGNVKVTTPFASEIVEVVQSSSHPEMHASRVAASMMMYFNAAKKARAILENNPHARPVIYDMGAGSYGGEKLLLMKQDPRNVGIYVHAAIPTADVEDVHRVTRLRTNPTFLQWNDVSVTHTPSAHRLNWCRHKARNCTCMGNYTHVFVLCVHSAYYFTQADFERIFEHTSSFESLEHIPEIGVAVPVDNPEYVWEDTSQPSEHASYSVFDRMAAKIRESISLTKQVRLQPLVTAATTYHHPDNGERIRNGGMHFNKWSGMVDNMLEDNGKMAAFATGVAAAGAFGGALGALGRSTASVIGAAAYGALSSLAMTTVAATVSKWDVKQRKPWLPGSYSVETSIAMSYENGSGDQTCHIVRYTKMARGTVLEPRVTQSEKPDVTEVGRVAAALATSADEPKAKRMMAAVLLRDNKPLRAVKSTLSQAARVVNFLFPPAPEVKRPPWLLKSALAVAFQPLVSGISNQAASAVVAGLCPSRFYQPYKIAYLLVTAQPATVIYLALVAPLHLFGLWVIMYLTDRLLSV